jgi:hypothetical protein
MSNTPKPDLAIAFLRAQDESAKKDDTIARLREDNQALAAMHEEAQAELDKAGEVTEAMVRAAFEYISNHNPRTIITARGILEAAYEQQRKDAEASNEVR